MKKWLKEEDDVLIDFYNKVEKEQIIKFLEGKYSWEAIKNRARKLKLTNERVSKNKNLKWDEETIEKFSKIWVSGTTEEINLEFSGFTYEALTSSAKRFGIKRDVNLRFKNKLNKLLIENDFNIYWLGFIMADGHFSSRDELKINLSIKDKEHLTILSDYLGVNISEREGQTYNGFTSKDSCGISIMDVNSIKKIKEKFNITNNKTYDSFNLDALSKDYYLPFFCGLVDGDGCITQNRNGKANMLRIQCHSAWVDILKKFAIFLKNKFNFNPIVKIDKQGYANFAMYRNNELLKLKEEILKCEIPHLERKWGKIN